MFHSSTDESVLEPYSYRNTSFSEKGKFVFPGLLFYSFCISQMSRTIPLLE